MVRITQSETADNDQQVIKVEGRLAGPWVLELARCLEQLSRGGPHVVLELDGLTYADAEGVALLRSLQGMGAELKGLTLFVAKLLRGEHERC